MMISKAIPKTLKTILNMLYRPCPVATGPHPKMILDILPVVFFANSITKTSKRILKMLYRPRLVVTGPKPKMIIVKLHTTSLVYLMLYVFIHTYCFLLLLY